MHPRGHANGERGADLLLTHCTALVATEAVRPSAFARLEQQLGGQLARMLVVALASRRRERVAA
jgi:hypothetical protein